MTDGSDRKLQSQLNDPTEEGSKNDLPQERPSFPSSPIESQQYITASQRQSQSQQIQPDYSDVNSMSMRGMANALPEYHMQLHPQQPFQHQMSTIASNSTLMYPQHQNPQNFNPSFAPQYQTPFMHSHDPRQQQHHSYPQFLGGQSIQPIQQTFQNTTYPLPYGMIQNNSVAPGQVYQQPYPNQYGNVQGSRTMTGYHTSQTRQESGTIHNPPLQYYQQLQPLPMRRTSSSSSLQTSVLRGPPRKPKQSGHALWVGNLPPGTHIVALKDHFSRDATDDIESVFLISKSNCAFVNYKTEQSCGAALSRFHDSRFQGVRLVCRLRRGSASAGGTAANISSNKPPTNETPLPAVDAVSSETPITADEITAENLSRPHVATERYFVVKSLTVEDLERSVQTGIWATQAHNEVALNNAYQSAENVYLIFSANKSGEYFGYARMSSTIDDESIVTVELPSKTETVQQPVAAMTDLPLAIDTPATATAPKGRIIDDSARGTIFWEADQEEQESQDKEEDPGNVSGEGEEVGPSTSASAGTPQTFGKPFKIVWISTERLPFYRTRGLRNPWNSNREVKIARDGTEIEPSVGRRLTSMFHRPMIDPNVPYSGRSQPGMSGGPSPGGYSLQQSPLPGGMYGRPY